MIVGLLIVKLIALMIGPEGLGRLGNFMNLVTMITVFAGGGIVNGIGKYVAEFSRTPRRLLRIVSVSYSMGLVFSAIVLLFSIIAAAPLARFLFGDAQLAWIVPLLGIAHGLCFFGTATIAVVNGLRRSDLFARIAITAYLGCLPIAFLLIRGLGLPGAALAFCVSIAAPAVPCAVLALRSRITGLVRFRLDRADMVALGRFSLMAVASATLFPTTEIIVRSSLIAHLGLADAGYWQAMTRLSGAYLGFFTLFLSTSFMPQLSAMRDRGEIVATVLQMLIRIAGAFGAAACIIWLLRDLIIVLLFSKAFLPASSLILWQLVGDFFRVSAYVIGFLGVAKAAIRLYLAAEFLQCLLYGSLALWTIATGGSVANVLQVYALSYLLYFAAAITALFVYWRRA